MNKNETKVQDFKVFEATPTQIASWKQQYGEDQILKLTIFPVSQKANTKDKSKVANTELPPAVCYVRKPTINEMVLAEQTGQNSIILEGESILENCWLDGDEVIKTVADYKVQACYRAHGLLVKMLSVVEKV